MNHRSDLKEADMKMLTNIVDTFPWINYDEIFEKVETQGIVKGEAKRDRELALNAFTKWKGLDAAAITENLKSLGIPDETIAEAQKQVQAERSRQAKQRSDRER
jgi:hypothetical protein